MARSFHTVVIGGGPAGYVAAIRLGQLGVKAALIEKGDVGGVCLNWGCIPSKAMIHVAHTVHHLAEASVFGVTADNVRVDVDKTRAWKDDIVSKLTGGVRQLVKAGGTEIIEGHARFTSSRTLDVKLTDGATEEISFERCIIATGARSISIPGIEVDGALVWGAEHAVDIPVIPRRLLVVGGGVIGLELGTVYAKLGSEVTIVEMLDGLLTGVDRDLVRVVERRLKALGVRVLTRSRVAKIEKAENTVMVTVDNDATETVEVDRVLVATGFMPGSSGLSLASAGVETTERGAIVVDSALETNVKGIFAAGDVTGPPYLAHRAFRMGEVAAERAAGKEVTFDVRAMPAAIFTDPEIAVTGMSEEEAKAAGREIKTGKFMLGANGRALGAAEGQGFAKTIVDKETGALLGAGIVGLSASEIISEITLGVEMGASAEDLGLTVHPHPTISETVQESALAALGRAIHAANRRERTRESTRTAT